MWKTSTCIAHPFTEEHDIWLNQPSLFLLFLVSILFHCPRSFALRIFAPWYVPFDDLFFHLVIVIARVANVLPVLSFIMWIDTYGFLHSMHLCVAKLPWASMISSVGTPARRSSVSMFCVKHVCRRDLDDRSWMKEWVSVGRNLPGYNSFASI